jgi:integrase
MATKATVITDVAMRAKPGARERWIVERGARGAGRLEGRITLSGARSFYFRYTTPDGVRARLLIGPYSPSGDALESFTVQQARDRARDLAGLYRAGVTDLRAHFEQKKRDAEAAEAERRLAAVAARREAERQALEAARRVTVRELFERWQRTELQPHTLADGSRTGRKDGGQWVRESFERRVFPALGDRAAADVTRADLLAILDDAKAAGRRRTANVLLADLRQMWRFAVEREIVGANPLAGIKRSKIGGADVERDRVLDDDELRALARALPTARLAPRTEVAIRLILATAVRVGEAMGARWEHVDLAGRRWHLPETKNGREHTIHLSDFALAQFEALAQLREACADGKPSPWVFPATDPALPVHVKSFGKQLSDRQREPERRIQHRSKATQSLALPGGRWTAHDLRRSAATIMARLGISTDTIDECLNHKLARKVARVYIRDRREAAQAHAFDAMGAHLQRLFEGAEHSANVVPLRAAAVAV